VGEHVAHRPAPASGRRGQSRLPFHRHLGLQLLEPVLDEADVRDHRPGWRVPRLHGVEALPIGCDVEAPHRGAVEGEVAWVELEE